MRKLLIQRFCTYSSIKQDLSSQTPFEEQVVIRSKEFLKQEYNNSIPQLRKERYDIQFRLCKYLMDRNETSKLISNLFEFRKALISFKLSNLIRQYLEPKFQVELSQYQRQFISYYFLLLRNKFFFNRVSQPTQKQEIILYNYSALMSGNEHLITNIQNAKDWSFESGTFSKQAFELKCYFDPTFNPNIKDSLQYHKRSKLQQQVELIMRNINIHFKRQQFLRCYKVDFIVEESKVVEVLGPSHFIPGCQTLKGDEEVRKKMIEKEGMKYITIGHHEWSRLKGLQEQRQFVKKRVAEKK